MSLFFLKNVNYYILYGVVVVDNVFPWKDVAALQCFLTHLVLLHSSKPKNAKQNFFSFLIKLTFSS